MGSIAGHRIDYNGGRGSEKPAAHTQQNLTQVNPPPGQDNVRFNQKYSAQSTLAGCAMPLKVLKFVKMMKSAEKYQKKKMSKTEKSFRGLDAKENRATFDHQAVRSSPYSDTGRSNKLLACKSSSFCLLWIIFRHFY